MFNLPIQDMLLGLTKQKRPFGCFAGHHGSIMAVDGTFYPCARFGSKKLSNILISIVLSTSDSIPFSPIWLTEDANIVLTFEKWFQLVYFVSTYKQINNIPCMLEVWNCYSLLPLKLRKTNLLVLFLKNTRSTAFD